jgi:hypothetical protein
VSLTLVDVEAPIKGTSRILRTSMSLGSGVEPYGAIRRLSRTNNGYVKIGTLLGSVVDGERESRGGS